MSDFYRTRVIELIAETEKVIGRLRRDLTEYPHETVSPHMIAHFEKAIRTLRDHAGLSGRGPKPEAES